jgi:hypothetical protein
MAHTEDAAEAGNVTAAVGNTGCAIHQVVANPFCRTCRDHNTRFAGDPAECGIVGPHSPHGVGPQRCFGIRS